MVEGTEGDWSLSKREDPRSRWFLKQYSIKLMEVVNFMAHSIQMQRDNESPWPFESEQERRSNRRQNLQ